MFRNASTFAFLVAAALFPAPAAAQTDQAAMPSTAVGANASAKQLMAEGNALYAQRDFEGAHKKFLEAWAVKQHAAIASNLIETEQKLGRYGEAANRLRALLATLPMDEKEDRAAFMAQLDECRRHLLAIQLTVNVAGATVSVNGHRVGTAPLETELLVEPGSIRVEAERAGYESAVMFVNSGVAGESRTLELKLTKKALTSPVVARPAPPANQVSPPRHGETGDVSPTRNYVTIGGVLLTATVATVGIVYRQKRSDAENDALQLGEGLGRHGCEPGQEVDVARCHSLYDAWSRYDRETNIMTGMFVAAGVTAVASVLTYVLWPTARASRPNASQTRAAVVPWSGHDGAGLQLSGRF